MRKLFISAPRKLPSILGLTRVKLPRLRFTRWKLRSILGFTRGDKKLPIIQGFTRGELPSIQGFTRGELSSILRFTREKLPSIPGFTRG